MKSLNDIACAAYVAHAKELARRIGVNSRPWAEIGNCEQQCWEQAARQERVLELAREGWPPYAELGITVLSADVYLPEFNGVTLQRLPRVEVKS